MLKLEGSASELHFNPKEDKIAVALAKNSLIDEHIMFRRVHIVHLKTAKATNLNNPGKLGQVGWSPDCKIPAIISGADKHDPREGRLWIHQFDSGGWVDASKNLNGLGHIESFSWSYDSQGIRVQGSIGVNNSPVGYAYWPAKKARRPRRPSSCGWHRSPRRFTPRFCTIPCLV